jgi:ClpA/ClpB-like protein
VAAAGDRVAGEGVGATVIEGVHLLTSAEEQHRRRTGSRGGERAVVKLVGFEHRRPLLRRAVERGLVDADALAEGEMAAEPGGEARDREAGPGEEPAAAAVAVSPREPGEVCRTSAVVLPSACTVPTRRLSPRTSVQSDNPRKRRRRCHNDAGGDQCVGARLGVLAAEQVECSSRAAEAAQDAAFQAARGREADERCFWGQVLGTELVSALHRTATEIDVQTTASGWRTPAPSASAARAGIGVRAPLLPRRRRASGLHAQGIEVAFTDEAVELLAHEGFDPEFGARPLRRTIQRLVENELSRMVLSDTISPGDRVTVDALEGELRFDVDTSVAREPEVSGERKVSAEAAPR